MAKKFESMNTGVGDKNKTASRHLVSPNPYLLQSYMLKQMFGEPVHEIVYEAEPKGFSVSRSRNKYANRAWEWARGLRGQFEHEFDIDHLVATEKAPIYIHTEAWYGTGTHCDPENTHKLAKDALFYKTPKGFHADKFTTGSYAGPLYDKFKPRLVLLVWRLSEEFLNGRLYGTENSNEVKKFKWELDKATDDIVKRAAKELKVPKEFMDGTEPGGMDILPGLASTGGYVVYEQKSDGNPFLDIDGKPFKEDKRDKGGGA